MYNKTDFEVITFRYSEDRNIYLTSQENFTALSSFFLAIFSVPELCFITLMCEIKMLAYH